MLRDIRIGDGGMDSESRVVHQHVDGVLRVFEAGGDSRYGLAISQVGGENFNSPSECAKLGRHGFEAGR